MSRGVQLVQNCPTYCEWHSDKLLTNNNNNLLIVPLHRPIFIFMDDKAPAHRGPIIRERQLETGGAQMERPPLSLDLNHIENLCDQLSHCEEA